MNNPVIEFKGYKITKIEYTTTDFSEDIEKNGTLTAWVGVSEDKKEAEIKLSSTVVDDQQKRKIIVEINGFFNICIEDNINEFLSINGTAILFPYIRSITSMISSLDNENAILLPTINTNNFSSES